MKNIFKFFKKKKGQSFPEYALIMGLVVLLSATGTSKLYQAAKHNFYFGLLPTNMAGKQLPEGPNGENGWYNSDYIGVAQIECSAQSMSTSTETDAEGNSIIVYEIDPDQEIFCTDTSLNGSRNNWGSAYKSVKLDGSSEKRLSLSIWDDYGIKHTTEVLIKERNENSTIGGYTNRTDGTVDSSTGKDVPIAIITLDRNIEGQILLDGDSVNISGENSQPLSGHSIDKYEWEIVDIDYVDKKNIKTTYTLGKMSDRISSIIFDESSFKICTGHDELTLRQCFGDPEQLGSNDAIYQYTISSLNTAERQKLNWILLKAEFNAIVLGSDPTATRYVRLRVQSNGVWSDWTQVGIKTGTSQRPYAVISTYSSHEMEIDETFAPSTFQIRKSTSLFMTYMNSVDPESGTKATYDLENYQYLSNPPEAKINSGIRNFQWHIYKLNSNRTAYVESQPPIPQNVLITDVDNDMITTVRDRSNHDYGFEFKEPGSYCITLSVQNGDGVWSNEPECVTDGRTVPNPPDANSVKYINVVRENLQPIVTGIESSPLPVTENGKEVIKGTIVTEFKFTPSISHPETDTSVYPAYRTEFLEEDYTTGLFKWKLINPNGTVIRSSEIEAKTESIVLPELKMVGDFTLELTICDKGGLCSPPTSFNIYIFNPTNYSQTVEKTTFTMDELPRIPTGQGTKVAITSDDKTYSQLNGNNFVDLNFYFLAYGVAFQYLDFSTNGLVTFAKGWNQSEHPNHEEEYLTEYSKATTNYSNNSSGEVHYADITTYTLMAYWDDLWFNDDSTLSYWVDNENQRLLLEYKDIGHYDDNNAESKQEKAFDMTVVISASGYIDIYYIKSDFRNTSLRAGKSATIGIIGSQKEDHVIFSHMENSVPNMTKLTFVPI